MPSVFTLNKLFKSFCESYRETNGPVLDKKGKEKSPISWGKFHDYWSKQYSCIKVLKKKTDFCEYCCKEQEKLKNSSSNEEEREIIQANLDMHLKEAKDARAAYTDHRRITALEDGKIVISMDYAECLMIPQLQNTPSTFYFKTRRKIDIFGISNERETENGSIQLNFLIDECFKIKKGPNTVITMLDYYIHNYIQEGKHLILYADNCPAHNKNQFLIGYLTFMVKIKKFLASAELYFLIVGHTKFTPDSHFGTLKKEFKKNNCFSIKDLLGKNGIVESSAVNNKVIPYKDPESGLQNFQWRNWKNFLEKRFRNCPGISSWHVIKIHQDGSTIQVSPSINKPLEDFTIFNKDFINDSLEEPEVLIPEGLSLQREMELQYFEQFVEDNHKKYVSTTY